MLHLSQRPQLTTLSVAALLALSLAACGGGSSDSASPGASPAAEGSPAATGVASPVAASKLKLDKVVSLTGAGATFPAPLYDRWFKDLNQANSNLQVNYQSVGSGAGVEQFLKKTVQFGASDTGMKDEEVKKAATGVIQLPVTAGSIVLAYNLPEVKDLKLSQKLLVDILLGKVKKWNDPAIAAINKDAKLPDKAIAVVYRSDGSGTTAVFTKNLSAFSPEWKSAVGDGKTVQWKTGTGAKGNEGVTAAIQQTEGAIGYVEYGYAKNNGLTMAQLENKAGKFIAATPESAAKTLSAVKLPENLRASIENPEGEESYPIVTFTWLLVYPKYDDPNQAKAVEALVEYGLTEGQKISAELGYIPLPADVIEKVAAAADKITPDYQISVK